MLKRWDRVVYRGYLNVCLVVGFTESGQPILEEEGTKNAIIYRGFPERLILVGDPDNQEKEAG